jgi:hypothetical protein
VWQLSGAYWLTSLRISCHWTNNLINKCSTPGGALLSTAQLKWHGACHFICYCSKECQKQDWKTCHKSMCNAYVARTS